MRAFTVQVANLSIENHRMQVQVSFSQAAAKKGSMDQRTYGAGFGMRLSKGNMSDTCCTSALVSKDSL